jgi:hypothetical protein
MAIDGHEKSMRDPIDDMLVTWKPQIGNTAMSTSPSLDLWYRLNESIPIIQKKSYHTSLIDLIKNQVGFFPRYSFLKIVKKSVE